MAQAWALMLSPFTVVAHLDDKGLVVLRSVLIGIMRDLSFPLQGFFVLVHLIGKKGGSQAHLPPPLLVPPVSEAQVR